MTAAPALRRLDSTRLLAIGGVLFVALGIVVGEIYAIYISHVANGIIGANWVGVIEAAGHGDLEQLREHFGVIEDLTARRGRTMHSHSHLGAYGLLALTLALLHPFVAVPAATRLWLAISYLIGAFLQVSGNYVAYYAGGAFHYLGDLGAVLVIAAVAGTLRGWKGVISPATAGSPADLLRPLASRYLVKSGLLLVILGMTFGLYYAWVLVSADEPAVYEAVQDAASALSASEVEVAAQDIRLFKQMQSRIAITAAAHSHAIELGFLMLLLAFVQPFVMLSERWRLRWARTLSVGAFALPLCVYLATIYGLRAAAFSDLFGGIALVALAAMIFGMIRHTGAVDAADGRDAR